MNDRAKELRYRIYARQRRLMKLQVGHETVCLPGQLLKTNPELFTPIRKKRK